MFIWPFKTCYYYIEKKTKIRLRKCRKIVKICSSVKSLAKLLHGIAASACIFFGQEAEGVLN